MLRYYLAAALRNLARNRLYAAINIIGLAVGFAAAVLAFLYGRHELSYDHFIPGSDRIYLMTTRGGAPGYKAMSADLTPSYLGVWMKTEFPGADVARLMPNHPQLSVRHGMVEALEDISWGDPNLFSILKLPVIAGDLASALERPDGVVLTRRMARKYFGRDMPIGETLEIERKYTLQVKAVIEDLPSATDLPAEIFGSGLNRDFGLVPMDERPYKGTLNSEVLTYVAFPPNGGQALGAVQGAMTDFIQRHFREMFAQLPGLRLEINFVPLTRLHMSPAEMSVVKPHGNPATLAAIGSAGMLIVLVALINFVNLMTARSARRAVEVGVRKVSGAAAPQLIAQFIGETLVYAALSMVIGLVLLRLVLPVIDARLAPGLAEQWMAPLLIPFALGLVALTGLLGGAYPAFVLSKFRPAVVLKGRVETPRSSVLRQALVAAQFGVLIALTLTTLVIYRQTLFSLRDGLRVQHDEMLMVYAPCRGAFTDAVRALPGVSGVACSSRDPLNFQGFNTATRADGTTFSMGIAEVGFGFFELYGIPTIAGRLFDNSRDASQSGSGSANAAILNESAVRTLGFASPEASIGQFVKVYRGKNGPPSVIIGVIPDFTFDLMTMRVPPSVYWVGDTFNFDPVLHLKLSGRDLPEVLDAIDRLWKDVGEPHPIRRLLVNQHLQSHYTQVIREGTLIGGFSAVAILISGLGLFGLSAFTAERRTKEIGVRKALGASRLDVLRLLLWEFAKPVLVANLLAWPIAYTVMHRWLEGFAYHIDLQPWMFLAASMLALVIAVLTVLGQALLVARAQPAAALRYE